MGHTTYHKQNGWPNGGESFTVYGCLENIEIMTLGKQKIDTEHKGTSLFFVPTESKKEIMK